MQIGPRRVLAKDAVILNGFDAGGARFAYGFVVDHFILQPKVRKAEECRQPT